MALKAAIVPVTPIQQNCTIVFDDVTKRAVVVDAGGDVAVILEAIAKLGVTIEKLVLTHGHFDHAGGVMELRDRLGAHIKIEGPHRADKMLLDNLEKQGVQFGMPGGRNAVPDLWLNEGETIDLAGYPFAIYHCPGHSPGSVVFVNRAENFALVGDVLFRGSIGRTDFQYGDHDALISSIKTKLLPLGDDIAFICGHGPASTFGEERESNPFLA